MSGAGFAVADHTECEVGHGTGGAWRQGITGGCLACLGILQAWSVALPWSGQNSWWLQVLSLAGLFVLLTPSDAQVDDQRRAWRGFAMGWWFGCCWLLGSFWWLYVSMHAYGGLPSWLAGLAVALLASAVAVFYGLAAALYRGWASAWGAAGRIMGFAAFWTLAELCRAEWFTGFPWGASGYAHLTGPLKGMVPWIGVYGVGWAAALWAAGIGCTVRWGLLRHTTLRRSGVRKREGAVVHMLLAWMLVPLFGGVAGLAWRGGAEVVGRPLRVTLLQGNVSQDQKFQQASGILLSLQWYGQQLDLAKGDLVVTPETALPLLPQYLPQAYWQALNKRFATGQQAALIGMPVAVQGQGYANVVLGMAPGGAVSKGSGQALPLELPPVPDQVYGYAKHHLVPFGEFVPWGFRWFVDMMHIPLGDFRRGALPQPGLAWHGERIQPNVCYEDLFGEELAAAFVDGAQAPTLLVNLSNIAWFGDTIAIDQHRNISRMRALELDRPMVRATNTGATAIIAPDGTVIRELPRLTRGVLEGEVRGRTGVTPYAWWVSRWGLMPLWVLAILVCLACVWQTRCFSVRVPSGKSLEDRRR